MQIIRTPLRVSLFGGGTDLPVFYKNFDFGQVLSLAVNRYIYISIHPLVEPDEILLKYSQIERVKDFKDLKHPIVREVLREYNLRGLDISISSDVPAGTGLGSSSAFSVGFYNAISNYVAEPISKMQLAQKACKLEIEILNSPIGKQDQFASSFGGVNHFKFMASGECAVKPIILNSIGTLSLLESSICLFRVGNTRSANTLLSEQQNSSTDNSKRYLELRELVDDGISALFEGDLERLGALLKRSWQLKKELSKNVSSSEIEILMSELYEDGCLGSKLLGAGGSGYVMGLFDPRKVPQLKKKYGAIFSQVRVDHQGSVVVYSHEPV